MNPLLDIDDQEIEIDIDAQENLDNPMNVLAADFVVSLRRQKYLIQRVTAEGEIIEIKPNAVLDTVTARNLRLLQIPELPEYAHALAKQTPLSYIKLGSTVGSTGHGAESYERPIVQADEKTWTQFCVGVSSSTSVKFLEFNSIRLAKISELKWKQFCESISKNQYLTALDISALRKERKPEIDKMIQTKTKDRHSKTFALVHCLHKLRFKNNPIHSALHKGLISNILTFFEVKPLCDQVEIELKPFAAKLESKPFN